MTERASGLVASAWQALDQYAVEAGSLHVLGHHDAIAVQVSDRTGRTAYLLRLHRPLSPNFIGLRQQPDALRSELLWLEALAAETEIVAPRPVRTRHAPVRLADLARRAGSQGRVR